MLRLCLIEVEQHLKEIETITMFWQVFTNNKIFCVKSSRLQAWALKRFRTLLLVDYGGQYLSKFHFANLAHFQNVTFALQYR